LGVENLPASQPKESRTPDRLEQSAVSVGIMLAVLWIVEAVDWAFKHRLDRYGIKPRKLSGLIGILAAPFLHAGWGHLFANTVPLAILGLLLLLSSTIRDVVVATVLVVLVGGFGAWVLGASNSVHIGASGVVFGWVGFLALRGFFSKNVGQIVMGLIVALVYGGVIWRGVLPIQRGNVSWQGHLFGFLGGALAAWLLRRRENRPAVAAPSSVQGLTP
jgi:membrane associated rhomboid family serine protease